MKRLRQAYLLRCWRKDGGWRYSLEPVGGLPQRRGFGTLEALIAFLHEEAGPAREDLETGVARDLSRR